MATVLCTRCGQNQAPEPAVFEVDPLCEECLASMIASRINRTCPGWGEDCGIPLTPGNDLCPDCTMGRMNVQSPRIPL